MSKSEPREDKSCLKTLVPELTAEMGAATGPPAGGGRGSLLRHALDGLVLLHGLLPVAAVELLDHHAAHGALVQAVGGDPYREARGA